MILKVKCYKLQLKFKRAVCCDAPVMGSRWSQASNTNESPGNVTNLKLPTQGKFIDMIFFISDFFLKRH